ncbi:type II secretion system protein N [Allosphingosinicella deserti]|uniref:Type II secretion system protein N n=1 Tax=Allosphingosinicella deserti TaxID=2116704 RepID=A0A2P7QS41_9SPHN|nr:type II secretion system protein N [Sphingomonas deserti]PSJ40767.1 hypothetical protein C7I55_10750 [Sphingomonas deserti]
MIDRIGARKAAWFTSVFGLALAATLPMKVAAGWAASGAPLAARDAEGTIWSGRLVDLRMAGLALGSPDAVALPVSLPGGEPVLSLHWGGEDGLRGRAAFSSRGTSVRNLTGSVDLAGAAPLAALSVQDFRFRARQGRCGDAAGQIKARLVDRSAALLEGRARCDGTALLLPLSGGGRSLTLRWQGAQVNAVLRGPGGLLYRGPAL